MSNTLTPNGRARVLKAIAESPVPLSAVEVSRIASIPLQQTRNRISELMAKHQVENIGSLANALYRVRAAVEVPEETRANLWRASTYTGEKPTPVRPGAYDFLKCPTREGDTLKPWSRPMLITRV